MSDEAETPTSPPLPSPASLAEGSREELVHGAARIVAHARAQPSAEALALLSSLRTVLLLRNERPALALTLRAHGELAATLGQHGLAAKSHDTEWGVRELLKEPFRAHRARLDHAEALFHAGQADRAELALRQAQQPARDLARGGRVQEAADALADTLARLSGLLRATGRTEEADLWLEGAFEVAPDADSRARAEHAAARFVGAGSRTQEA